MAPKQDQIEEYNAILVVFVWLTHAQYLRCSGRGSAHAAKVAKPAEVALRRVEHGAVSHLHHLRP